MEGTQAPRHPRRKEGVQAPGGGSRSEGRGRPRELRRRDRGRHVLSAHEPDGPGVDGGSERAGGHGVATRMQPAVR